MSVYLKHVENFTAYNYKSIFIVTDDPSIIEEARVLVPRLGYNHLIGPSNPAQKRSISKHSKTWDLFNIKGNMFRNAEFEAVLLDILLFADTDGIIGKFTSNIARIAFSLNFGRRGCAMPFISLDSFWCFGYMQRNGIALNRAHKLADHFAC